MEAVVMEVVWKGEELVLEKVVEMEDSLAE